MKSLCVIVLILGCSALIHSTAARTIRHGGGKVIGGRNAVSGEFPYQVSLQAKDVSGNYSSHFCGGAILDKYHILTAGHCLHYYFDYELVVVAGALNITNTSEQSRVRIQVAKSYTHEEFEYSTVRNDIALLRLEGEFPLGNPGIAAIPLRTETLTVPATCTLTGWGNTAKLPSHVYPSLLQVLDVPFVAQETCVADFVDYQYHILPGMMCAGYEEGEKDACDGDSGGPLACDGQLSGLVSWGNDCALPNYPGVYAEISYYHDWIQTTLATSYKDGGLNQSER